MLPAQRILVTGATGFLGYRIVESLAEESFFAQIVAAGRTLDPARHVRHSRVAYRLGDLTDPDYCRQIVEGCSHVVNCASLSSPWGDYETFYRANVLTQSNLIEAGKEAEVQRFVYISTPSIYFNFRDRYLVSEGDPLPRKPVNHYAETKLKAERILEASRLEYIILRPRAIIGRGDRVIMPRLFRAYDEGRLRIVGNGLNTMDLTSAANVVHAVRLSLAAAREHCGEAYNVTNDDPVPLWEAINYALREMGLRPIERKAPYRPAIAAATVMAWWAKNFSGGDEPALAPYSVANLARSMTLDVSKIRDRLGYAPLQSTYEAIDEFVAWYREIDEHHGVAV